MYTYESNRGPSFSIDLAGRPEAVIAEEIRPILQFFNRVSGPDRRVFICHATEDKPFARLVADSLKGGRSQCVARRVGDQGGKQHR